MNIMNIMNLLNHLERKMLTQALRSWACQKTRSSNKTTILRILIEIIEEMTIKIECVSLWIAHDSSQTLMPSDICSITREKIQSLN